MKATIDAMTPERRLHEDGERRGEPRPESPSRATDVRPAEKNGMSRRKNRNGSRPSSGRPMAEGHLRKHRRRRWPASPRRPTGRPTGGRCRDDDETKAISATTLTCAGSRCTQLWPCAGTAPAAPCWWPPPTISPPPSRALDTIRNRLPARARVTPTPMTPARPPESRARWRRRRRSSRRGLPAVALSRAPVSSPCSDKQPPPYAVGRRRRVAAEAGLEATTRTPARTKSTGSGLRGSRGPPEGVAGRRHRDQAVAAALGRWPRRRDLELGQNPRGSADEVTVPPGRRRW